MGCADQLPVWRGYIPVDSPAERFVPSLREMIPSLGLTKWDFAIRILQYTGDVEVAMALQYAKVRQRKPEAPATISSYLTLASGDIGETKHVQYSVPTGANDKFWVTHGPMVRLPNANSNRGWVELEIRATKKQCARLVGQKEWESRADASASHPEITILSDFVPALDVASYRAALLASAVNQLEYEFWCRTAKDPEKPNAWVQMNAGTYAALSSGQNEINTGNIAIPSGADIANNPYIQFGISLRMTSGGSDPRGLFKVVNGVIYS